MAVVERRHHLFCIIILWTPKTEQSGAICRNTAIRCVNVTAIPVCFWIDYHLIGAKWWRRRFVLMRLEVEAGLQSSDRVVRLIFMPCEKIRVCVNEYVQNPNEAVNIRRTPLPAGAPRSPTPGPHYACLGWNQSQAGNRSERIENLFRMLWRWLFLF